MCRCLNGSRTNTRWRGPKVGFGEVTWTWSRLRVEV
jgi:hypothetical protein